jgi:hypothetical protein
MCLRQRRDPEKRHLPAACHSSAASWPTPMTIKRGVRDALWMVPSAAMLLMLFVLVLHFNREQKHAEGLALRARRIDVVEAMRSALARASEAEKSAVLALADQDSQTYAGEARAATAEVERARRELQELLKAGGTQDEKNLLEQFSQAFGEFERIDRELLELAVRDSNLKAYSLAFGPAAKALEEADAALSRVVAKTATRPKSSDIMRLAFGAQAAALRIQALLAPHIAEESDKKMHELEAMMAKEDQQVHHDLDELAAIKSLAADPDLATASSSYARFSTLGAQILALSRENTNVRSVAISLGQKRKVKLLCQSALDALQQAIRAEPPAGVDYGRFGRPLKLP